MYGDWGKAAIAPLLYVEGKPLCCRKAFVRF